MHRLFARLALAAPVVLILAAAISAVATANTLPASNTAEQVVQSSISADDLKPTICNGITLTALIVGTGANITGTNATELILGTSGAESIDGKAGADCILGGGGNDTINGGGGADVCDGGPGTDTAVNCTTTYNVP